jgi:predicted protein tyrosine phosphatase
MTLRISISDLTICGLDELHLHGTRGVTHVLSILDPGWPNPEAFGAFDPHHLVTLNFHDIIEPTAGQLLPSRHDVETILRFGRTLPAETGVPAEAHLLVHCHAGISRSTAAMATILAEQHPDEDEDRIFDRVLAIRGKAWPNSRMIGFADEVLGRGGRMLAALGRLYRRQLPVFPHLERFMRENGRTREVEMAENADKP